MMVHLVGSGGAFFITLQGKLESSQGGKAGVEPYKC